jgi:hypothetical protein
MRGNHRTAWSLAALAAAACASLAPAQGPTLSQGTTAVTSALTEPQQAELRRFVTHWVGDLASGDPAKVKEARTRLTQPVSLASLVFQNAYGRELADPLGRVVTGKDSYAAVNALHIAAAVASDRTIALLLNHVAMANEPQPTIRLTAAKCLAVALPAAHRSGAVFDHAVNQAARTIGRAAAAETDWIALLRQFEALAAVGAALRQKDGAGAATVTTVQLEALAATIQRLEQSRDGTSDLMRAVHPTLYHLRNTWLNNPAEQKSLGAQLAPLLGRVFDVATAQWEVAQRNPDLKNVYGGAIKISEDLLALIDRQLRSAGTPQTASQAAWNSGDKPRFEAERSKWLAVLAGPPYAK